MNDIIKQQVVDALNKHSDNLRNNGCNDFYLEVTPDNIKLYIEYLEWNNKTNDSIDINEEFVRSFVKKDTFLMNNARKPDVTVISVFGGDFSFVSFLAEKVREAG